MLTDIQYTQLKQTLCASNYAQQVMDKQPNEWQADFAIDQFSQSLKTNHIQQLVTNTVAAIDIEADWMREMRKLRARLMLRWIWRDANQMTDVMSLTRELSDFADAAIQAAVRFAKRPLLQKYGEPIGNDGRIQELIVFAMGKLGAFELNLSSDIDLIFAYDENGESDGSEHGLKSIDVQQYCILWGQSVIRLLDLPTVDGFVFRVDMRLRPWGDGSPLAMSHVALDRYLEQHGRDWERYAWIKARVVNGSDSGGNDIFKMSRAFVYRLYVDYAAFNALREMKNMIDREVIRRELQQDVKLGAGGIRDIEFIVQAFQLIYGGARKELRIASCLETMQVLVTLHLLPAEVVSQLTQAYLFLRRFEHAIQALDDQQTQQVPTDINARNRIATAMHYPDWESLERIWNTHRQLVRAQFATVVADRQGETEHESRDSLWLQLTPYLDEATQNKVQQFWQSKSLQRLPEDARKRLDQFWPRVLRELIELEQSNPPQSSQQQPLQQAQHASNHLIPLVESVLRRTVYLMLLLENPLALKRLVKILAVSPWIAEELARYPVLLDEFLVGDDHLFTSKSELKNSLHQQMLRIESDDVEGQMRLLRLFKKSAVLAVAASDVLADRPLMKVSDALTDIAEVVLEKTLYIVIHNLAAKHGYPLRSDGTRLSLDAPAFAIIGYGKLGGIEMSYGSDLDLVFLHNVDEQSTTDGLKPISGMEFVARIAQKLMSLLTTQTLDGRVYEIDTRLRPSGHSGMLVASLAGFESYQLKEAWVWEHQALVRSRALVGDATVLTQFNTARHTILTLPRDTSEIRQAVIDMREKMYKHLGSTQSEQQNNIFHLKQDRGGIVDIEFMAQYCVLIWGHQFPEIVQYSDNIRILQDVANAGCLTFEDTQQLTESYLAERAQMHRLALAQQDVKVDAREWLQTRKQVELVWTKLMNTSFGL